MIRLTSWMFVFGFVVFALLLSGCLTTPVERSDEIHVYTRSDSCGAAETWANYLGGYHQEDLRGVGVYGDPGLVEAVRKDPLGIGYNNLNYAYDAKSGAPVAGIRVIPIDLDENGALDRDENFYSTKIELIQAIQRGDYPSPPARDLYLVTKGKPQGLTREFILWCLTEGQNSVSETGYIPLAEEKRAEELEKIGSSERLGELHGTLSVSGAWALYPLMERWKGEFEQRYPGVRIDLSAGGAGKGMADVLGEMVDIGMVSRELYPQEVERGAVGIAVTTDCVVPVMNEHNPVLEVLVRRGVKRQEFVDIWITGEITRWGALADESMQND